MKQHQRIAKQMALRLGHNQAGVGAADHPMEVTGVKAVSFKTLIFEFQQFINIRRLRRAIYKVHVGDRKE